MSEKYSIRELLIAAMVTSSICALGGALGCVHAILRGYSSIYAGLFLLHGGGSLITLWIIGIAYRERFGNP